ncbi:DNA-directed DNA polymerase [Desulfosarcina widdelii]|uniref:DNA-directed DNA polymerase n=1 Tax=Desulfosarcina widdelii TaxID=947919 RepID=A0A5K7YWW4_9BACT|nr:DNA polymerase III subunit alpha [Desulfosarcina widdelii]BBO72885.1 DNA-directed DNA polymerase [Desulfosarcina widdelii]
MVPLTTRSHYSLMQGTDSPAAICRAARRMGYDRLALTDTDNLYGLWKFLQACKEEGLVPIVGAEISDPHTGDRAVCLVKNPTGYANLCQLITRRQRNPEFSLSIQLPQMAEGLLVLTARADLLAAWHHSGVHTAAALPGRPLSPFHPLVQTARRLKIPLTAAPNSFFLEPCGFAVHRLLRAIAGNTTLSRLAPGDTAPDTAWLASPEEYRRRFAICPQAVANTHRLASELTFTGPDSGLVMPPWQDPCGRSTDECLRRAAYAGARRRYGGELGEGVVNRLEHELATIAGMNFSAYFLVVKEIISKSPRTCGRGSAAASLVAYCLGITNVCPVKHNLYFGRFLNPGRTDPPDIDVDFAWDERDAVIDDVLQRFGNRAAMVASHILFQPRMALRETAKVFGMPDAEIGAISRRLPWFWRRGELDAGLLANLRQRPETRHLDFAQPWPRIMELAQRIIGIPRHLSVHPGGVVITPNPVDRCVPVETAPKGVPVIQWDKDGAEDAGLVKIDLLGNRSLGVIRDALASMRANGIAFDEMRWEPEDDPDTRDTVARGRTMGCFYIESPAMRLLHSKAGQGDFDHLVIHSSIIRPAANEYIQEYLRRLHGGSWDPIHPLLADVLDETFGIMVYQEDVSRAATALAGFSDAEADGLRKIISKKDRQRQLADYRERFLAGARSRGVSTDQANAVWEMMMSFSGYSFCKPHSASYARVSFQAAFLKTHQPAEFMAGVISNQGGFYSTFAYVSEARRMGLIIDPPDVTVSRVHWTGRGRRLRVGLMAVGGLSRSTMERILRCRRASGFRDMADFLERVQPDEDETMALIHCGALDGLDNSRSRTRLAWERVRWQAGRRRSRGQMELFADCAPTGAEKPPRFPPTDPTTRLRREFTILGFLCDRHPITLFADAIPALDTVKADRLADRVGRRIRLAAWLVTGKVVRTKRGDPMEFLTFEDETGIVETTFFPEPYRRFCHMLDRNRPYLLEGKVETNWGVATLTVDRVGVIGGKSILTPS